MIKKDKIINYLRVLLNRIKLSQRCLTLKIMGLKISSKLQSLKVKWRLFWTQILIKWENWTREELFQLIKDISKLVKITEFKFYSRFVKTTFVSLLLQATFTTSLRKEFPRNANHLISISLINNRTILEGSKKIKKTNQEIRIMS